MLLSKINQTTQNAIHRYSCVFSEQDLSLFRILVFSIFLLMGFEDFSRYHSNNINLFNPPLFSIPWLIGGYPSFSLLKLVSISLFLSSVACIFKFKVRLALVVFIISFILGKSFEYSFGMVDHDNIMYPIFAFLMLLNSLPRVNKCFLSTPAVYLLMAFAISFAFLGAGVPKVLSGWLNPSDQKFKHTVIYYNMGMSWGHIGEWMLENIKSSLIWEFLDWLAVLFECLLIFTIVKPRYLYWGLWACLCFHQFNYWTIGISFMNAMVFYLLFLPIINISRFSSSIITILVLTVPIFYLLNNQISHISIKTLAGIYSSSIVFFHLISIILAVLLISNYKKLHT